MNTLAENIATGVAGFAAITILITAASPHWLPPQDLPPPLIYADALARGLEFCLDNLLRACQWLESAFDSARASTIEALFQSLGARRPGPLR